MIKFLIISNLTNWFLSGNMYFFHLLTLSSFIHVKLLLRTSIIINIIKEMISGSLNGFGRIWCNLSNLREKVQYHSSHHLMGGCHGNALLFSPKTLTRRKGVLITSEDDKKISNLIITRAESQVLSWIGRSLHLMSFVLRTLENTVCPGRCSLLVHVDQCYL